MPRRQSIVAGSEGGKIEFQPDLGELVQVSIVDLLPEVEALLDQDAYDRLIKANDDA